MGYIKECAALMGMVFSGFGQGMVYAFWTYHSGLEFLYVVASHGMRASFQQNPTANGIITEVVKFWQKN